MMAQNKNLYDSVAVDVIPSVSEGYNSPSAFLHGNEVPASMEMREIQGNIYDKVAFDVEAPPANGSVTGEIDGYSDRRCIDFDSQEDEFDDSPRHENTPQVFTDHRSHVTSGHVNDGEATHSQGDNNEDAMFITNKKIYSKCCVGGFSILVLLLFVFVGFFIENFISTVTKQKGCPQPIVVENGIYSPNITSEYNVGSNVTYRCLNGSRLCGEASIVCKDQGTWSSSPPSCLKECFNKSNTDSELVADYATTESIPILMTTIPKTTIPKTTIPKTTIPKTTIPKTTIAKTTIPKTTVPKTTIPKTTIPKTTIPKTTIPKTTITLTTIPKTIISSTTIPKTTIPMTNSWPY